MLRRCARRMHKSRGHLDAERAAADVVEYEGDLQKTHGM